MRQRIHGLLFPAAQILVRVFLFIVHLRHDDHDTIAPRRDRLYHQRCVFRNEILLIQRLLHNIPKQLLRALRRGNQILQFDFSFR